MVSSSTIHINNWESAWGGKTSTLKLERLAWEHPMWFLVRLGFWVISMIPSTWSSLVSCVKFLVQQIVKRARLLDWLTKRRVGWLGFVGNLYVVLVHLIPWEVVQSAPKIYSKVLRSAIWCEISYVSSCVVQKPFNENSLNVPSRSLYHMRKLEAPHVWKYEIWVPNMWLPLLLFKVAIRAFIRTICHFLLNGSKYTCE